MRMTPLAAVLISWLALAGSPAHAQSPGEISFWESVRDSRNPAELRAYLQQYPNGTFKALAEARLATLERGPATPAPQAAPAPVTAARHALQAGDSWTYRLSYPRLRGQWGQPDRPPATYAITLSSTQAGRIQDVLAVDGGTPATYTHEATPTLLQQGASIFSPYLFTLDKLPGTRWYRSVVNTDADCSRRFICEAKARVAGSEQVTVPAGTFFATKVIVEHDWRGGSAAGARFTGGRTLTVWYAPEIGRAVKYSSRMGVGDVTPVDPNFDLELVSYKLK